ncbi:MAG: glycosyltransferase family 1 protein [Gammaproteobacteria bacterium]
MSDITVNGRFLTRAPTGVDRFAAELLRAWLPQVAGIHSVKALMPPKKAVRESHGLNLDAVSVGALAGHAWEQLELPRHAGSSMLLNLCNTGPVARRRQLVVLHDAGTFANPATYSVAFRGWYRWMFAGLMRRAGIVATVSKFSAGELMKHVGGRAEGIELIQGAGDHILRAEADRRVIARLGLVGKRYVLAVGSRTPNKNFAGVARAAALLGDLGYKVVAAGGSNARVFNGVALDDESLILAGYVTDGELRALYEQASCFVFPSLYEGFGLPPLEAMLCGCPVVVSDRASLPEVCGQAALYCNPDDPVDIAAKLRRVLTSHSLQKELREAGRARARQFGWGRAATQLEELLSTGRLRAAA